MSVSLTESTSAQFTTADAVLAAGAIGQESDTGRVKIGDGTTAWTSLAYFVGDDRLEQLVGLATAAEAIAMSAGGGGGSSVPVADAAGVTIDDVTNPFGDGASPTAKVMTFPNDTLAVGWRLEGDAFPRVMILADPIDGWYFGDGTKDPFNDAGGAGFWTSSAGDFTLFSDTGEIHLQADNVSMNGDVVIDGSLQVNTGVNLGSSDVVTASLTTQFIEVATGDVVFQGFGKGPVVIDDTDGHTYRLTSHNGVLTMVEVA